MKRNSRCQLQNLAQPTSIYTRPVLIREAQHSLCVAFACCNLRLASFAAARRFRVGEGGNRVKLSISEQRGISKERRVISQKKSLNPLRSSSLFTRVSFRTRGDPARMVAVETQSQSQVARAVPADAVPAPGPRIPREARRLLHELAAAWADVADCRALEVVPLKGAMTNEVYQVRWLTGLPGPAGEAEYEPKAEREVRKVLVRIYGDGVDLFFDREDEVRTFECMSRHGQGPRLLGRFPNGRVEEFIHARTLSAADLRDPEISALVASKLREFHNLDMPGPKSVLIWDRLRNWLKTAKNLCPSEEAKEFRLDSLENEITALENECSGDYHCVGFCHNDLQYGNIMIDEETNVLTIIDYEYASFNPVAYDIANHFCEMAANYHSSKPHLLDYSRYPDVDEQRRFVKTYLSISDEEPDAEVVENLLQSIEKYMLASHLVWGLWGIISDHVNDIDFDYKEYARQRFDQYWQKKSAILTS